MGRVEETIGKNELTPDELEHRGATLQALGALLLVFNAIPAVFVFVGIRTGSYLWLYWTAIEGLVGMGLIAAGKYRIEHGTIEMARRIQGHLEATGEAEDTEAA